MADEIKLIVEGKELSGDWTTFKIGPPTGMYDPFNARDFLKQHTDMSSEDINKIDKEEKWAFDGWDIKGDVMEVFFKTITKK